MKLPEYKSLEEKNNSFNSRTIDSFEGFFKVYSSFLEKDKNQELIFRGINEARYKIFNSAQRHWMIKELYLNHPNELSAYHKMIQILIDNVKKANSKLLPSFYKTFNLIPAETALLSFLQHFGAPTPLLDWTYELDIALFFAIDGIIEMYQGGSDIDNYFSIFIINNSEETDLINLANTVGHAQNRLNKLKEKYPNADSESVDDDFSGKTIYSLMKEFSLFYISDFEKNDSQYYSDIPDVKLYTDTNYNIINQKGLFIFNNHPKKPLEEYFLGKNVQEEGQTYVLGKITCLNIHKKLAKRIKYEILDRNGINSNFIYPNPEQMAKNAFEDYLRRLS